MSGADRPPRVWITGIGLVSPLAPTREATWEAIRAGRCRVWPLMPDGPKAGLIDYGFPAPYRDRFRGGFDPVPRLLGDTAIEAIRDARLFDGGRRFDPQRAAVLIGLSKGRMITLDRLHGEWLGRELDPKQFARIWPRLWPNDGASTVARLIGATGPCLAPIAACATGLVAAARGADLIRRGDCDLALVGAADASLSPFLLGAFRRMHALARIEPGDDPGRAVRPWDRRRSGFLVGEGAAILVLERADLSRARGLVPYAEFVSGVIGSDAFHLTDLNPDPTGLAHLIRRALEAAGVAAAELDYVNVHGTATRSNDPLECRALRRALGGHADAVACSANKAQIGHLLGAAGAVELAITCLAIRDGFVPPTLNLTDPDPACDLDGTPRVGRPRAIRAALKLSLGFGGHLAAAVLRRPEGPRQTGPPGAESADGAGPSGPAP